jgi:2-oxoglutarate dehydrogenase E2 component (dihydrolipoamide succinyltransferase)
MAENQLVMPKMGESIAEATIIKWTKNEGDNVAQDETILEIATDKVDSEIPSPYAGVLIKKLFKENDVVPVGTVIAIIADSSPESNAKSAPAPDQKPQEIKRSSEPANEAAKLESNIASVSSDLKSNHKSQGDGQRFYSPLVLNIARTENISMQELEKMNGTGAEGRVTKRDILAYVGNRGSVPAQNSAPVQESKPVEPSPVESTKPSASPGKISLMPGDEIIEMDRMRKLISDHMVMSKHTSPHVTSFVECDVTNLVRWREKIKGPFEKKESEKKTLTPIFIECVVRAIKDFPMINVSIDGTKIIKR